MMATEYELTITGIYMNIRKEPSDRSAIVGRANKGEKFRATKRTAAQSVYWYFIPSKGWISSKYSSVKTVTTPDQKPKPVPAPDNTATVGGSVNLSDSTSTSGGLSQSVLDTGLSLFTKGINFNTFRPSMRLFGQPFQFNELTDPRILKTEGQDGDSMGRIFAETFVGEGPVVSILPGRSNFLPNMNDKDKEGILSAFTKKSSNTVDKWALDEVLKAESRYFDFTSDYTAYMNYVNLMCRMSASYMGLADKEVMYGGIKTKYRFVDWKSYRYMKLYGDGYDKEAEKRAKAELKAEDKKRAKMNQGELDKYMEMLTDSRTSMFEKAKKEMSDFDLVDALFGKRAHVEFYADPNTSFQEAASSQTGPSMLSAALDQAQHFVKEAQHAKHALGLDNGGVAGTITDIAEGTGGLLGGAIKTLVGNTTDGMMGRVTHMGETIIGGGNIVLPEIWNKSQYSKSYNITLNLTSPYGDPESIYLHLLVPLYHIMALTLPRQITANGYGNPFLVKVSAKGWFNCELGIIDSVTVEKIPDSFTVNGLPTEIRVTMSVKDLYADMSITSNTKPGLFFNNSGMMNWLAVTSGLDMTQPSFAERFNALATALTGQLSDMPSNLWNSTWESIRNKLSFFPDWR